MSEFWCRVLAVPVGLAAVVGMFVVVFTLAWLAERVDVWLKVRWPGVRKAGEAVGVVGVACLLVSLAAVVAYGIGSSLLGCR